MNNGSRDGSIVTQAPCRADLAGSTLDLWPLYLFHPGAVTVNFAVSIFATCRITPLKGSQIRFRSVDTRKEEKFVSLEHLMRACDFQHGLAGRLTQFFRPERGFEMETNSESPAGAGIAGSSALMIASTAALARFTGRKLSHERLRILAQNIEAQLINVPTGCQDYYPALYGGVNAVELAPDGIHRHRIAVPAEEIEARFLLAYTGAPRQSGINNWEVFKAHINGDSQVVQNFESISQIAIAMRQALGRADWKDVGRLLREEWKLRRSNAPGITTPVIDNLVSVAERNGGRGAKVCGAGGGGCVVFFVENGTKARVAEALRDAGGHLLPFRVAREGLSFARARAASHP